MGLDWGLCTIISNNIGGKHKILHRGISKGQDMYT